MWGGCTFKHRYLWVPGGMSTLSYVQKKKECLAQHQFFFLLVSVEVGVTEKNIVNMLLLFFQCMASCLVSKFWPILAVSLCGHLDQ